MASNVIPKNQASGAYPRWQVPDFDGTRPPVATTTSEPVPQPEIVQQSPLEIAPGIQLPTAEELENLQEGARQEGYQVGYVEGASAAQDEAQAIHALVHNLDEALNQFENTIAEDILKLSLEIARQVIRDSIKLQPELILTVIREALEQFPQNNAVIRLNPQDITLVRQHIQENLDQFGHRLVHDESIQRGGCIIESQGGQIDAQVATRWRRAVEHLGPTVPPPPIEE